MPLRQYFASALEPRLTRALVRLASAKKEIPTAVNSTQKEMAFLANELYGDAS